MAAFCSWNREDSRSEPLRYLSTHRITQPSSLETNDLVVKSLTQSSKHLWTRLEYIWAGHQGVSHGKASDPAAQSWDRPSPHCEIKLTVMNSFICFFSMRPVSSRCSAALRLLTGQELRAAIDEFHTYLSMMPGG